MNDTLSPLIWESDDKIKDDVRKVLLKNAKRFIEFSGLENLKFKDVILTGSMANYNYNDQSDLDVHIILDFNQISENIEFIEEFLKLKKQLWSDTLPIQVKGHDVEMYFQNSSEPHRSSGTYSLIKNAWISKPTKKIVNVNVSNIKSKSANLMNAIDDLSNIKNSDDLMKNYSALKDKIKKYRQTGLDNSGEFSTENLVFKVLRNTGYLKKLVDIKNQYLTQELSLTEDL
jgi:predicted nucleotidyltransferase